MEAQEHRTDCPVNEFHTNLAYFQSSCIIYDTEDVEAAKGPCCKQYKSTVCFVFSLSRQTFSAAHCRLWVLLCTFWACNGYQVNVYYRPIMCPIGPKAYNRQHQNVPGHFQTHIGQENGQSGKKTLCLFNIFLYDIMKYHHYFEDLKDELCNLLV